MASIEEYVELLLPIQQEKIAMAALRGIRWERIVVKDSTWVPRDIEDYRAAQERRGHYSIADRTKYEGYLPDGKWFGDFDDVYECAVRGLSLLDMREAPPAPADEPSGPDAPFALAPGNEQPPRSGKPGLNYRGGKR